MLQASATWVLIGRCLASGLFALAVQACQPQAQTVDPATQTKVEGGAKLSDVTLKQANEQGQLLWKLQAKTVTYGEDLSVAQVKGLQGQLYSKGKAIYKISAAAGTVEQSGQLVILKGQTVTRDLRNRLVLKAPLLQWQGEPGILQAQAGFVLTHPQVKLQGQWLQAINLTRQVNARGKVVAETQPSRFRLTADQVQWQVDQQLITAGANDTKTATPKVTIEQLKPPKYQQGSNRAYGGSVRFNLKSQIATLQNPAQVTLQQPLVDVTSRRLVWDLQRQRVNSDQLIEVKHRQEGVSVVADRGVYDQRQQLVQFKGKVEAQARRNQSRLTANTLRWQLQKQRIDAQGNVRYRQGTPPLEVKGPKAVGKIQEQMIQISGGNVVTEILP